jgi:hypothetical protein
VSSGSDCAWIDYISFPPSVTVAQAYQTEIKVMLEGPYAEGSMIQCPAVPLEQPFAVSPWDYDNNEKVTSIPENVVDWVLVELRDAPEASSAGSSTTIGRRAAFLLSDGSIVNLDGISNPSFNAPVSESLFIVIRQRNHLAVMTANSPTFADHVYSYDFTVSASQAYGTSAQTELSAGLFGMYAGDINADGIVNITDKTAEWEPNAGKTGYRATDINLDGQSDNPDKNDFLLKNLGKSSYVPQ